MFSKQNYGKRKYKMKTKLSQKNLFLVDGIGAVVTALLLSQLLARFESVFGMPKSYLYPLAGTAACFAIYSLSCYFFLKKNRHLYLRGIAFANSLYCLVTLFLIFYLFHALTWLGMVYFSGEITIVMGLASIEFRSSKVPEY